MSTRLLVTVGTSLLFVLGLIEVIPTQSVYAQTGRAAPSDVAALRKR